MRFRWPLLALLVLGAAIGSTNASATLLYAGGEDIDFIPAPTCGTNCFVMTSAGTFRSNWARETYGVRYTSASDPPTTRFATPVFTASSQIWVHAQVWSTAGGGATTANQQLLRLIGADGNPAIILRGTGTAGQIKISKRDTSGVITDLLTCASAIFPTPNLDQLDVYVNYAASGEVNVYRNSVSFCDYTGDVTTNGRTQLNAAEFSAAGGSAGNDWVGWSEVVIATTDTRAMNLYTLSPNGNGNATQWTGTNPCTAILNATAYNDTSYVTTGSNSQIEECTVRNSLPTGSFNVQAVVMSGRLLVGSSGPQHFDFVLRTGGADYTSSDFAPTNSFSNIGNYIQALNPATGNAWAIGDITAAGFNIGLESKP